MKDGSTYKGSFIDGEITGHGQRTWECGMQYDGEWLNGEKNGFGECKYGKRNYTDNYYRGEWRSNLRHGQGELGFRNGAVVKGNFANN